MNVARDHHYVPQFFLRNFAVDTASKKITTVAKHGAMAIWSERSIEHLGYERDLYIHMQSGVPVSVEQAINEKIENPISKSDTWAKISSGRTASLDRSDKPILYALIRHLEARNPHYEKTGMELARLAASKASGIPFTDEEREMYAAIRARPDGAKAMFNAMASSVKWTESTYRGAGLSIFRSPIPLRSSSTPVLATKAPEDPALYLPLPGMSPFQLVLTLNRFTIASLVLGNFDDAFMNCEIPPLVAMGFNRQFVGQFAHFDHVRHLITGQDGLADDMTWAPYDLVEQTVRRVSFRRR